MNKSNEVLNLFADLSPLITIEMLVEKILSLDITKNYEHIEFNDKEIYKFLRSWEFIWTDRKPSPHLVEEGWFIKGLSKDYEYSYLVTPDGIGHILEKWEEVLEGDLF